MQYVYIGKKSRLKTCFSVLKFLTIQYRRSNFIYASIYLYTDAHITRAGGSQEPPRDRLRRSKIPYRFGANASRKRAKITRSSVGEGERNRAFGRRRSKCVCVSVCFTIYICGAFACMSLHFFNVFVCVLCCGSVYVSYRTVPLDHIMVVLVCMLLCVF